MPTSSKEYSLSLMTLPIRAVKFIFSSTTATMTGTSRANPFIPIPAAAAPICGNNATSSTTTNFHGCELQAEGASRAASRHFITISRLTGRDSYFRSLCRFCISSDKFILTFFIYAAKLDILWEIRFPLICF